jgi:hypothetical protein
MEKHNQEEMYEKATELADLWMGKYSHVEETVGNLVWFHYNFNDNLKINQFIYDLHTHNIGLLVKNTSDTSCAVLL